MPTDKDLPIGRTLPMSNAEIVRSYQQAEDKKKQLKILAELNLCKNSEIVAILEANGVEVPEDVKRARKRKTFSLEDLPEVEVKQSQEDITLTDPEPQVAPAVKNVQETSVYELSIKLAALDTIEKMLPQGDFPGAEALNFTIKVRAILDFVKEVC